MSLGHASAEGAFYPPRGLDIADHCGRRQMTHSPSTRATAAVNNLRRVSLANPGSRTARIARPSTSTRSSRVRAPPCARRPTRACAMQRVDADQGTDDSSSPWRRLCRDSAITASTAADAPVSGMDANDA